MFSAAKRLSNGLKFQRAQLPSSPPFPTTPFAPFPYSCLLPAKFHWPISWASVATTKTHCKLSSCLPSSFLPPAPSLPPLQSALHFGQFEHFSHFGHCAADSFLPAKLIDKTCELFRLAKLRTKHLFYNISRGGQGQGERKGGKETVLR